MLKMLFRWVLNALALFAVPFIVTGITVSSFTAALIAAVVLGLVNAIVRPLLVLLTLPATVLTLGLFLFVINALCFWLAGWLVPGFVVPGFIAALLGSLVYSVITTLTSWLLFNDKKKSS